jgi:hypothetical protein
MRAWRSLAALSATLALGVALGGLLQRGRAERPSPTTETRTLRKLDELDARVQQLSAAYERATARAAVVSSLAHDVTSAPGALAPAPSPAPAEAPVVAEPEAPTPQQIAAGDRLVALTDRIIQAGRFTAEDRQALREASADADPERRDETRLALVRSMNAQQVKPTEPGPMF